MNLEHEIRVRLLADCPRLLPPEIVQAAYVEYLLRGEPYGPGEEDVCRWMWKHLTGTPGVFR